MVVVRGVNLYPSAVEGILRSAGGVVEFRVEIFTDRSLPEMSIEIEPVSGVATDHIADRVAMLLQNAFNLRVSVRCVTCGTLPRFEGKAKRWFRR